MPNGGTSTSPPAAHTPPDGSVHTECNAFDVDTPVFEGDATTVRLASQEALTQCDAVVLFYGSGDEAWRHMTLNEIKKAGAYRGDRPLPPCLIYLAQPTTDDKSDLLALQPQGLIDGIAGFDEGALNPLLEVLQKAWRHGKG